MTTHDHRVKKIKFQSEPISEAENILEVINYTASTGSLLFMKNVLIGLEGKVGIHNTLKTDDCVQTRATIVISTSPGTVTQMHCRVESW